MQGGGTRLGGRGGLWRPRGDSRGAGSPEAETAEYHCSVMRAAGERDPGFQDSSACWHKAAWGFWRFRPRSDPPALKTVTDSAQGPGEGNPQASEPTLLCQPSHPGAQETPPSLPQTNPGTAPRKPVLSEKSPKRGRKSFALSLKRPDMKDRDEQAASSVFIFPQLGRAALAVLFFTSAHSGEGGVF